MRLASVLEAHYRRTDRMFRWLLLVQWAAAIAMSILISPYAWNGRTASVHQHVYVAIFGGALVSSLPVALTYLAPGRAITRHTIAVAQMLWSALIIHLTGGRIESHFHVFGSLAFLAFYADWRVLVTATLMVVGDHFVRGLIWPQSVYGVVNPEWWRFFEHAVWVLFEDVVLVFGCLSSVEQRRQLVAKQDALELLNENIEAEVARKTTALAESLDRLRDLIASTDAHPWEIDTATMCFTVVDASATPLVPGTSIGSPATHLFELVHIDDRQKLVSAMGENIGRTDAPPVAIEYRLVPADGKVRHVRSSIAIRALANGTMVLRGLTIDVTEWRQLETELHQAQKLESIGRLAAGVAHEINTPVQFVSDNLHFVRDASRELFQLVDRYRAACLAAHSNRDVATLLATTRNAEADADLDFVSANFGRAIDGSLEGIKRVATIARSMKEFAHPDQREMVAVDINRALQSTIAIASNEYKYVADMATDFGEVPPVLCFPGELNQVFLNLIVNAAHAIEGVVAGTPARGTIRIASRVCDSFVVISVGDTGGGIPVAIRDKIFDPFFTTKEVGRGTGQGLAIARSVVDKHGGDLRFESEVGVGTTFFIRIPIDGMDAAKRRKAA